MIQTERRIYLIEELFKEQPWYERPEIPEDEAGQKRLLRPLFNIRMPRPVSREFLTVQDAYLQEEIRRKGITDFADLRPVQEGIYRQGEGVQNTLSGAGSRNEHARHSQVFLLAHDGGEPASCLCLHKLRRSLCAAGDCGSFNMHQWGYRRSIKTEKCLKLQKSFPKLRRHIEMTSVS